MTESMLDSFGGVQSLKRQRRGAAAKVLLALYEADQLAEPEKWTWDAIDALPVWCLQDELTRHNTQLLCGALVLAPELRLWIDRKLIVAAHDLIGQHCFDHIVAKADNVAIAVNTFASTRISASGNREQVADSVKASLLQAGASVFKASLSDELPLNMLPNIVGETAGSISSKVANAILDELVGLDQLAAQAQLVGQAQKAVQTQFNEVHA